MLQHKLLNNFLYLSNILLRFKKVDSHLCSYSNEEETNIEQTLKIPLTVYKHPTCYSTGFYSRNIR